MAMFRVILAVTLVVCISALPRQSSRADEVSETISKILSYGYPAEAHRVTTSDGYILETHRIPHGKGQQPSSDRPVVFLMHGLLAASNCYVHLGPESALAFNLADAGYDVWMGNARGNLYSRRHVTLNPDDPQDRVQFFDFSWEDIALKDISAMIDYALATSGNEKLHYIGHSQGGTVFFALMSSRPEYNDKIITAHLMAGVGYMKHFPTTAISALSLATDIIYSVGVSSGLVELLPAPVHSTGGGINDACEDSALSFICDTIGLDSVFEDTSDAGDGLGSAGASLKQLAHFGQNLRDREFRSWSYGLLQNMRVYGSMTPPRFNLELITADVTMHYTLNDNLLGEGDVLAMANDMPNAKAKKVARESFTHVDFVVADDAKELVTNYIINAVQQADGRV